MIIYYFGADKPYGELLEIGFRRRNTCILNELIINSKVDFVFVIRRVPRKNLMLSIANAYKGEKVKDVFFASILPDKFFNKLNRVLAFIQIKWQINVTKHKVSDKKIIWSYWPRGYCEAEYLSLDGPHVFDSDHNLIEDPNLTILEREAMENCLTRVIKTSALILSSSRSMLLWFKEKGAHATYLLLNGVNLSRFDNVSYLPLELKNKYPIIGYIGTLSKWIKYDWLNRLAKENPQWNLVLIGSPYNCEEYKILKSLKNVHFLGDKAANEVPSYLKNFNVGIGLYQCLPGLDVNSMKLYEYLAAKIPVVTNNYHPNLSSDFGNLLQVASSYEDFIFKITNSLKDTSFNDEHSINSFLEGVTWKERVDSFLNYLCEY